MTSARATIRKNYVQDGRITWIGIRIATEQPMQILQEVEVNPLVGVVGDHGRHTPPRLRANAPHPATPTSEAAAERRPRGMRQVTLLQHEHLAAMSSLLGRNVAPEQLRRNLCVEGLPLLALVGQRFWVGEVMLEGTGICHPCDKLEELMGKGGYNAAMGHSGITARVIEGGTLRLGDGVRPVQDHR